MNMRQVADRALEISEGSMYVLVLGVYVDENSGGGRNTMSLLY